MRYAAITAALFGGAFFMATGSHASLASTSDLQSVYNKPAIQTVLSVPRNQALATTVAATTTLAKADASAQKAATPAPEPEVQPQPVTVAVATGDNLTKLAKATGTTYQRLYDANPVVVNPDMIYPGQELRVPTADETLADRPLPVNAPVEVIAAAATPSAPRRTAAPAARVAPVASGSVWDNLAACESGGNWAINTGNGFYGGLQFTLASWQAAGGTGMPNEASREEQINRGQILQARGGWGNWPACSAKLGLS